MPSHSVPNFLPSHNAFVFTNSWPNEPDITVQIPGIGTVTIGNAQNGLCGGMVFAVDDYYQTHEPTPRMAMVPALNTPLYNYIVRRLFDSFNIPGGVLEYFSWMNTPDHDTGIPPFIRRGLAWMTIMNEWPKIQADIDGGNPSPLGLVTVKSLNPGDLGMNHQVLAYGYVLDNQQNLTIQVYDPNSGGNDGISMSLNIGNPTHTTPITTNINLEPNLSIHGFFRTSYSPSTPPLEDGHLWHTERRPDGSWSGLGNVNGQFAIPGPVSAVSAASSQPGETQFMFTTQDGHLWHTERRPDGSWSGLGDVNGQFAIPGPVSAVSATSSQPGETQFMFTT